MSFWKAEISSGVGGSPVKSRVARRIKSSLLANGTGFRACFSRFARKNLSIFVFAHFVSFTAGTAGVESG